MLGGADLLGRILDSGMLFACSVIKAVRVFDVLHSVLEHIGVGRNRYDICIIINRQDLQVTGTVESTVNNEKDP